MSEPVINKVAYQHADIELQFADEEGVGLAITDAFSELTISDSVEREKLRGASQVALDATDGEYDADGNVTWFKFAYDYICEWAKSKGRGFYNLELTMTVNYRKKGEPMHTMTVPKVMFASREHSSSAGPDALTVPCDLFIKDRVYVDGVGPFGETL